MNSIPLALSEFSEESYLIHINSPMTKICHPNKIKNAALALANDEKQLKAHIESTAHIDYPIAAQS